MSQAKEGASRLDRPGSVARIDSESARRAILLEEAQALARLGSWEWDLSTSEFVWSAEMYRLVGLAPESIVPDFDALLHMVHPDDVDVVQTVFLNTLRAGAPLDVEFRVFLPDGEQRTLRSRGHAIVGDHGRATRVLGSTQDVTEWRAAERAMREAHDSAARLEEQRRRARLDREYAARLRSLNESFLAITAVTRVRATLRRTAEQAVRLLGVERVVADLNGVAQADEGEEAAGSAVTVSSGSSVAPEGSSVLLPDGDRLTPHIRSLIEQTHEPVLLSVADAAGRLSQNGADPLLSGGLRGLVAAPLVGPSGEINGTIWATGKDDGSEFSETDLAIFVQLSQIASIASEKARRFERERAVAATLQRSILPDRLPEPRGARLDARYVPGGPGLQVGGDWYDAIEIRPGHLAVVIGDVEGHGVRAAAAMGQLRNAVRVYAWEGYGPAEALTKLNDMVERLGDGQFSTLMMALIDVASGEVRICSAGHPPPLLVPQHGAPKFLDIVACPPMGALPGMRFAESRALLARGDRLVLYTDGLVERRDRSIQDGLERLARVARSGGPLAATIDRILAEVPHADHRDDIAIIGVSLEPILARRHLSLPAEAGSLSALREELREFLSQSGLSDGEVYDTTLACSEAAANAIEHPVGSQSGTFEVDAVRHPGEVIIDIHDHGAWSQVGPAPDRGRGLRIMAALSDVAIDRRADGTTVTLRRDLALNQAEGK